MSYQQGTTATLLGEYTDGVGAFVDPSTPRVSILDPDGAAVVTDAVPTRTSLGHYSYDFAIAANAALGTWTARWSGIIGGALQTADDDFIVVPAATVAGPPLADVADVACRIGRTLTAAEEDRLACLLDDASAAVRAYTGQHFTLATTTARLRVRGGKVRLPQSPVSDVAAVTSMAGVALSFTWYAGQQVIVASSWPSFEYDAIYSCHSYVDVTYTHGNDTIPPFIVGFVANVAIRLLGSPPDDANVESETIGGYTYRRRTAVHLTTDEKQALEDAGFARLPVGPILMERV